LRARAGKPIVFSLGNFIFRQGSPWAGPSAIFGFTISPAGEITLQLRPVRSDFQARLATGAAADSVRWRVGSLALPVSITVSDP
jgi:poly-gamma-glutamate capsule biosynthesis protein CapA/YwtB (metallophosphatase superfamily)